MKLTPNTRPLNLALAAGAALLASCVHSSGGSHSHGILHESEPNDLSCCPDYFGTLVPGEFLSIQGFISDDGFDPYDGFAFTAFEPITVEFRLFADHPAADLDVCLYDPQLGIFVDCFESPFDPEVGVAHILLGGTEFHLVVNSFLGSSSYALELDVFPLHFDGVSAEAPAAPATTGAATVRSGAEAKRRDKADRAADFEAYHDGTAAAEPEPEPERHELRPTATITVLVLDPESGELSTTSFAETSEGTLYWMGTPDEADAK
ncbi:MAG: hypothetical protein AAF682_29320 [Planctomycetota bacterium]